MSFENHSNDRNYLAEGYCLIALDDFPEYVLNLDSDYIFSSYWQRVMGLHGFHLKEVTNRETLIAITIEKFKSIEKTAKPTLIGNKDTPPEGYRLLSENLYGNYVLSKDDLVFTGKRWLGVSNGVVGLKASACYGKRNSYFPFAPICIRVDNSYPFGY